MANCKINLSVDTKELDRLAIGARIYDALDSENANNLFKRTDEIYYRNCPKEKILGIKESDVINLIKLVNEKGDICFPVNYVIIRD